MVKYALFDLDGTLLDTLRDLYEAVNHALACEGMPPRTPEEVRAFVGNGIRRLIERAVPAGTDAAAADRVQAAFSGYYAAHCTDHTAPYPGVPEALGRLREAGVRVAIVSNKTDPAVQTLCAAMFGGLYELAVGEREGLRRKPAPDMPEYALAALGAAKTEAVYIGDSDVDLETAKNAGLPLISVLWGFRDRAFLEARGADRFAETPAALTEMLLRE